VQLLVGGESQTDRSSVRLALTALAVVVVLFGANWVLICLLLPDWGSRASFGGMFGAVGALFSGVALAGVAYALVLQSRQLEIQRIEVAETRRDIEESKRLSNLRFAMDLAPKFNRMRADDHGAWQVLRTVSGPRLPTSDPRWGDVLEALEAYYRSAQFVYQLAVLSEDGSVDLRALYLLYYDYLTEHPEGRLARLAEWVGHGMDLAANYTWEDVVRLARATERLLVRLNALHQEHGGTPHEHQVETIRHIIADLQAQGDPHF